MPSDWRQFVIVFAMLVIAGCNTPLRKGGKSPLQPAQMSPDSVVLEMFFVRCPFGDSTVNGKLWDEIDEQQFAPALRERLAKDGFRVGMVSGQTPVELSNLMQLSDKPPAAGEAGTSQLDSVENEPRVLKRHLQLRANQRGDILASGVHNDLPLLTSDAGQISGQTYHQAQGIFAVKSLPQPDGRVRLELVPELHHGQPQQQWIAKQGMWRLETGRPKRAFDDMTLSADLAPGAMLVMSSLPNRPGSLGHYFFTEENGGRLEQKLLIIRLTQTQHDGLFNPPEPLKLEE
jgi:hypothetical protein